MCSIQLEVLWGEVSGRGTLVRGDQGEGSLHGRLLY